MYKAPICALLFIVATCTGVLGDDNTDSAFIRCYNGSVNNYKDVAWNDTTKFIASINTKLSTVFILHGHNENCDSPGVQAIVRAYLEKGGYNVCVPDYRRCAAVPIVDALVYVRILGIRLAATLDACVKIGLNLDNVHIIGHSLGAQLAGHCGANMIVKIGRMTGLDPCGPKWGVNEPSMNTNCAKFVDFIHTDAGQWGITGTFKVHVNVFINGGHRIQPGCPVLYLSGSTGDFCSHHRSWQIYAESVKYKDNFIGRKCSSETLFLAGSCNNNLTGVVGLAASVDLRGDLYLLTKGDVTGLLGLGLSGAVAVIL